MAAPKYYYNNDGRITQKEAAQTSAVDSVVSSGADGKIDISFMPTGIGADTKVCPASEALTAGNFVNLWSDGGTLKARKADATTAGKEANGFVLANVASGANATVYRQGDNTQLTGMTIGARQYLATTAGGRTETAPSATGNVIQYLGTADSATSMTFEERESFVA